MSDKKITVHIGEVKTARRSQSLHAILGSCLGIAILWDKRGRYGLAHCLVPEIPENCFKIDAKYVDQAIRSLIALLHVRATDYKDIRVVIAGGAHLGETLKKRSVGVANVEAAKKMFDSLGIDIWHEETGGNLGRKISVFCATGNFNIKTIPKHSMEVTEDGC